MQTILGRPPPSFRLLIQPTIQWIPTLPLDSDWYKNRTVEEVDAHFASVIAASLKAQGAAFRQRQVIPPAGAITLDEADDDAVPIASRSL